jgi:hypothetical protein
MPWVNYFAGIRGKRTLGKMIDSRVEPPIVQGREEEANNQ